jgi:hypothetical protein
MRQGVLPEELIATPCGVLSGTLVYGLNAKWLLTIRMFLVEKVVDCHNLPWFTRSKSNLLCIHSLFFINYTANLDRFLR